MGHVNHVDDVIHIDALANKHVLVLSQSAFAALNTLLFDVREQPEKIAKMAEENGLALGANHIQTLSRLWNEIHGVNHSH